MASVHPTLAPRYPVLPLLVRIHVVLVAVPSLGHRLHLVLKLGGQQDVGNLPVVFRPNNQNLLLLLLLRLVFAIFAVSFVLLCSRWLGGGQCAI